MTRSYRSIFALVPMLALLTYTPVRAQSIWMPRGEGHSLLLEAIHTKLDLDEDFPSGILFFGGRFAVGEKVAVVAEVPYVTIETTSGVSGIFDINSRSVGNPYVGVELPLSGLFFAELGARAPLADDEEIANLFGIFADPARFDAFLPNAVAVHGIFNLRQVAESGLVTRLRLGPVVAIPTGDNGGDETELFLVYAWQIGWEGSSIRAGSAITGSTLLTEGDTHLGERTATQFEFHADFGSWMLRPGVDVRVPIGEAASVIPVEYGISLGATF